MEIFDWTSGFPSQLFPQTSQVHPVITRLHVTRLHGTCYHQVGLKSHILQSHLFPIFLLCSLEEPVVQSLQTLIRGKKKAKSLHQQNKFFQKLGSVGLCVTSLFLPISNTGPARGFGIAQNVSRVRRFPPSTHQLSISEVQSFIQKMTKPRERMSSEAGETWRVCIYGLWSVLSSPPHSLPLRAVTR